MKKKISPLLNAGPDNLLVTPQKAHYPIQLVPVEPEHDKIFKAPLTNGAKKIIKEFRDEIKKIKFSKTIQKTDMKLSANNDSEYYTCEEIATKMNLSLKEVKRQMYERHIVGQQKVFGKWLVHKQTFDKWLLRDRQIEVSVCRRK